MRNKEVKVNKPIDTVAYGETVIPENRLKYLAWKCKETLKRNPGNVLEVGVYRGGTLIALAEALKETCPEYKVYGIDTFLGHPYTDDHPVHPKGKYADVNKSDMEEYIKSRGLENQIVLYEGRVEEILNTLNLKDISFSHIDCDLYIPVKYCAKNVSKIMKKHGVIYFDDYGHEHCPGATKAIEEVFEIHQIHPVYMPEDNTCWSGYVQL
jgi:O-methyltransferase